MIGLLATLVGWSMVVLLSEFLWRKKIMTGEYTRKLVHVVIGISLAFTPFYLSWRTIQVGAAVAFGLILFMHLSGIFKSIYDISRQSWGDLIGPLSFMVLALFQPSRVLFMAAVLHVAVADGFAAIIGVRFGKGNQYRVLGYTKSIAGTLTFICASFLIMTSILIFGNVDIAYPVLALIAVPLVTALVENLALYGIDNALITATVVGLFAVFRIG